MRVIRDIASKYFENAAVEVSFNTYTATWLKRKATEEVSPRHPHPLPPDYGCFWNWANTAPSTPPNTASSTLSVTSSRTIRPRPAPSAARTTNSRCRAAPRATARRDWPCDEQHDSDRDHQYRQRLAKLAARGNETRPARTQVDRLGQDAFALRRGPVRIARNLRLQLSAIKRLRLGARLFERHAVAQACEEHQPRHSFLHETQVTPTKLQSQL